MAKAERDVDLSPGSGSSETSTTIPASALLDLARLRPTDLAAAVAAATRGATVDPTQSRPDLVRLADLVTHANLAMAAVASGGSNHHPHAAHAAGAHAHVHDLAQAQAQQHASGSGSGPEDDPSATTAHGLAPLPPPGSKKYTRSRKGCLTCRSRKVRCDEVRDGFGRCLRCAGMGRECKWAKDTSADSASAGASVTVTAKDKEKKPNRGKATSSAQEVQLPSSKPSALASKSKSSTSRSSPDVDPGVSPVSGRSGRSGVSGVSNAATVGSSSSSHHAGAGAGILSVPGLSPWATVNPSTLTLPIQPSPPGHLALGPDTVQTDSVFVPNGKASADARSSSKRPRAESPAPAPLPTPLHATERAAFRDLISAGAIAVGSRDSPRESPRWDDFVNPSPPQSLGFSFSPLANPVPSASTSLVPQSIAATGSSSAFPGPHATFLPPPFAWAASVAGASVLASPLGGGGGGTSSSAEVIELARSDRDNEGNIRLTAAPTASTSASSSDVPLSLSLGSIAARRRAPAGSSASTAPSPAAYAYAYLSGPAPALDPFMHAFPTASARGLFKHYVDNTSGIVTAMGRIKPGQNPFLAVSLPLVLMDTASPACAALRFSLLTTSAAHILHLRGGQAQDVSDLCEKLKRLAIGYTVMSQSSDSDEDADLVLAACVILMTRDVLNADRTWRSNLDFAIACVRRRGGPEQLMARDPGSFTKRFVLEQIVTHEVFSCFTTGGEPTLLTPFAPWWFDVESSSRTAWEWESVENLFGISRAMVEIIARICSLCARKNRLGPHASLDELDMAPVATYLRAEAESLIRELEIFGVSLRSLPLNRRVQYGDHIYRLTMSLHLMTEILNLPSDHPRVRALVPAALELCSEISMQPVMLVWPLLILSRVANDDERDWMRTLLATYSDQYCRDLQTAHELIDELWVRLDEGRPPSSWHAFMEETGKDVMLI